MNVYYVYAVLSENVACRNLRIFWVTNYSEILSVLSLQQIACLHDIAFNMMNYIE